MYLPNNFYFNGDSWHMDEIEYFIVVILTYLNAKCIKVFNIIYTVYYRFTV